MHVDRRIGIGPHPPKAVHIRREHGAYLGQEPGKTSDIAAKKDAVLAVRGAEQILAGRQIKHRLMNMHRAARLVAHRLGQEGRIDPMLQCDLPYDPLEQQHFVGQTKRIAMEEIDLQLRGARLVNHRVDVQPGLFGEIIDMLDDILELIDGLKAIRLACCLRAT